MDTQSILIGSYATVAGMSSTFGVGPDGPAAVLVQIGGDGDPNTLRLGGPEAGGVELRQTDLGTGRYAVLQAGTTGTLALITAVAAGGVTLTNGQLVLSNGGLAFGLSVSTGGATLTAVPAAGGGRIAVPGSTVSSGTVVVSASNNLSFGLSQSTQLTANASVLRAVSANVSATGTVSFGTGDVNFGINGQTVTAVPYRVSYYQQSRGSGSRVDANLTTNDSRNHSFQRFSITNPLEATRLDVLMGLTGVATEVQPGAVAAPGGTYTAVAALYTINGSTIGTVSTGSQTVSWASQITDVGNTAASEWAGQSGFKWRSIPLGTWSLTPGEYMLMLRVSGQTVRTGDTLGALMIARGVGQFAAFASNTIFQRQITLMAPGPASQNFTPEFGDGQYTGTAPPTATALSTVHLSAIAQTGFWVGTGGQSYPVVQQPYFRLLGTG